MVSELLEHRRMSFRFWTTLPKLPALKARANAQIGPSILSRGKIALFSSSANPRAILGPVNLQAGGSSSTSKTAKANKEQPRSVPNLPTNDGAKLGSESSAVIMSTVEEMEQGSAGASDWNTSFRGLGAAPFPQRTCDILLAPVSTTDVEITPDGLLYLPEIKYRRILNRAFGPGGWGIVPRTKTMVTQKKVTREYGLVCLGRLVSVSRGEMDFFSADGITTAMEGCKSNALMRCCKDLGIASELWDPSFIREFKRKNCDSKYFEKRKRFVWKLKDRPWEYPYN